MALDAADPYPHITHHVMMEREQKEGGLLSIRKRGMDAHQSILVFMLFCRERIIEISVRHSTYLASVVGCNCPINKCCRRRREIMRVLFSVRTFVRVCVCWSRARAAVLNEELTAALGGTAGSQRQSKPTTVASTYVRRTQAYSSFGMTSQNDVFWLASCCCCWLLSLSLRRSSW